MRIGITGRGAALPPTLRRNDDPLFDWLKANDPNYAQSFYGYDTRHVLKQGESILTYMKSAATDALAMAGLAPADVDLLLGYVSVNDYAMPNGLAQLHGELGLSAGCWIIPVNDEYSNFNAGLVIADAMIRAGQAGNALIACGGNWSRYVNYHVGAAASAADGAGAAVLAPTDDAGTFRVVDYEVITQTELAASSGPPPQPAQPAYGNMFVGSDVVPVSAPVPLPPPDQGSALLDDALYTQPYFHLTAEGMEEFKTFGTKAPVQVVKRLLARNALAGADVSIIAHQTSRYLLDAWAAAIQPRLLYDTLSSLANMTLASIPVNFALGYERIATDHLVLLGIGPELHAHALLLRRHG